MSLFHYSGYPAASAPWRAHICGLYYNINLNGYLQKTYLPQVELQAHATILATTSRTVLTQTFINPSTEKGIKEVRYTFPLYDGVSVVGFTCHVADRTIIGEVKEKQKARAVFKEAVARGETAGLLEQLPDAADVFTTTVGNIPPGARVIIKITYLGELKHDMEVDGIRFTIPNVICPRYGSYPGTLRTNPSIDAMGGKISITVDAEMAEGSFIQKIQSPTHPISMTMGTTSFAPNAEPTMTKASATLALGTAQLETDFVLQVIAKDTGVPKAVLETHPTIPNHRALMATLVPKFALPAEKPEIVFVCDRSGSMSGSRITLVIQALKVFLKSLPVGVKFNICSFGSKHSFLWKKSVTYSQSTLDEAIRHADTFSANFGGTEMLYPLKATIEQRYKDMPLEVMMLTDGEIWNQQALFSYLNQSVTESKAPIRIFTLGIGNGVSHSLIEGVAKAGNGFSQTVGEGEKMDSKVVRMLKGALSPHVNDYTLEVKYSTKNSEEEDDFEIVERVADSLKVKLDLKDSKEDKKATKKPISLFDASVDPDKESPPAYDETGEERYAHLPKVPVPKIIQAPQNIPSLFAFNRTTAYLLLGPDAPQATPKSVVLRGTSTHGPLELEIPIHTFDLPGETIHQLAAKKAISELEQGRGWLPEAKNESGTLIKSKFEGRFDDMVEREAVRLGVQFQVGGKWCSFVAVESNRKNVEEKETETQGWEWLEDEDQLPTEQEDQQQYRRNRMAPNQELRRKSGSPRASLTQSINRVTERGERLELSAQTQVLSEQSKGFYSSAKKQKSSSLFGGGLFGSSKSSPPPPPPPGASSFGVQSFGGRGGGAFGGTTSSTSYSQAAPQANPFASASGGAIGGLNAPVRSSFSAQAPGGSTGQLSQGENALQDYHSQFLMLEQQNKKRLLMARQEPEGAQQQQQFQAFGAAPASAVPPPPRDMARRSSGAMANAPAPFSSTSIFGAPAAPVSSATLFGAPPAPAPSAQPGFSEGDEISFGNLGTGNDKAVLDNFDFDSFLANDDTDMGFSLDEEEGTKATRSRSAAPVPGHAVYAPAAYSAPVKSSPAPPSRSMPVASALPSKNAKPSKSLEELLHHLISLQTFEGSWECTAALLSELPLNQGLVKSEISGGGNKKHFATAIVIAVFEGKLGSFKGSWELVVDKAKEWLESEVGDAERLVERARKVLL